MLHYRDGFMDVYEKSGVFGQRWQLWKEECEAVVLGRPCLVREVATGVLTTTAIAPSVDIPLEPQTILEVFREWKQNWFWRAFRIVGDLSWVVEAIEDGSLLAVACSCAFVFECQNGGGRILDKLVESSKDVCAYRGELLGLLAIHLILLAVKKL